ncbi:transcription cofactor HES-6-like [Latimeria chalumnae]|uniref:transcription cofactor HES-6-like n=1 Tax=Latimeria chalumnae TaxID=7897 RepID=UPI00313C0EBB
MTASTLDKGPGKHYSAKEERKLRKPLIEKKRRERINSSLEQLKTILVEAYNLDQSKLEKADILEITVQHMENLQRNKLLTNSKQSYESQQRYGSGYIQCMHEVYNLFLNCHGLDKNVGARLLNHLLKSLPQPGNDTHPTPTPPASAPGYQALPLQLPPPASRESPSAANRASSAPAGAGPQHSPGGAAGHEAGAGPRSIHVEFRRPWAIPTASTKRIPVLTYGHKNWVMSERVYSRVKAAEMYFLRRAAGGVSKLDRGKKHRDMHPIKELSR